MKLENQVCTLEQAKRLRELGIVQDQSIEQFVPSSHLLYAPQRLVSNDENYYAAFTLAELGVMIPAKMINRSPLHNCKEHAPQWEVMLFDREGANMSGQYDTEAEARAAMLIGLIELNIAIVEEINKRLIAA